MRDDIGLGAFLDREGVLEDRRAVFAESHHTATGLDLEWTGHSRSLDILGDGLSVDLNVEVLAWQTLNNVDLGVIGGIAGTDRQPRQSQDPAATSRASFDHRAPRFDVTFPPRLCLWFFPRAFKTQGVTWGLAMLRRRTSEESVGQLPRGCHLGQVDPGTVTDERLGYAA